MYLCTCTVSNSEIQIVHSTEINVDLSAVNPRNRKISGLGVGVKHFLENALFRSCFSDNTNYYHRVASDTIGKLSVLSINASRSLCADVWYEVGFEWMAARIVTIPQNPHDLYIHVEIHVHSTCQQRKTKEEEEAEQYTNPPPTHPKQT
jgi:hypothetical protein